jgi:nitroreductase
MPLSSSEFLEILHTRYATKQFDPNRKIAPEDWSAIEDALILTPSSGGLQPWKFIVITDVELRKKLTPATYNQPQINDASHFVVFASKNNFSEADVDAHLKRTAEVRGVALEALTPYRDMLVGGIIKALDETQRNAWARNQAYIALGNLLTTAAVLGIDACPMEGFDRARYDEILGLRDRDLASAGIATLGYRLSTDKNASAPKVRFPKDEVIIVGTGIPASTRQ